MTIRNYHFFVVVICLFCAPGWGWEWMVEGPCNMDEVMWISLVSHCSWTLKSMEFKVKDMLILSVNFVHSMRRSKSNHVFWFSLRYQMVWWRLDTFKCLSLHNCSRRERRTCLLVILFKALNLGFFYFTSFDVNVFIWNLSTYHTCFSCNVRFQNTNFFLFLLFSIHWCQRTSVGCNFCSILDEFGIFNG